MVSNLRSLPPVAVVGGRVHGGHGDGRGGDAFGVPPRLHHTGGLDGYIIQLQPEAL